MNTVKVEIMRLLSAAELTKSDAMNLMVQLRICLEAGNLKSEYSYLTMYCDWTVHPQLSRSMPAFQIIESISEVIVEHANTPPSSAFFGKITKAFLFQELRNDFINVSKIFNMPDRFCSNKDIWKKFLVLLISILLERPLEFPDPPNLHRNVVPIYNRIQKKWKTIFKNTLGIKKVALILGAGESEGRVLWSVELIPGPGFTARSATLRGPLSKLYL